MDEEIEVREKLLRANKESEELDKKLEEQKLEIETQTVDNKAHTEKVDELNK